MHFRYARHTDNLVPLIQFYTTVIGLKILGEFKDHDQYDGVFLGKENAEWHLEFTTSYVSAKHKPDEDDLLVFYFDTEAERMNVVTIAEEKYVPILEPKNPYWEKNGIMLSDPDGFGVVLAIK
jgi:hypothetical protein